MTSARSDQRVPAIQGNDMWVSQRIADGSGNVLDCDLEAGFRRATIRGEGGLFTDPLTFGFDVFTKSRWETSSTAGETSCLQGSDQLLHNILACVNVSNDRWRSTI